MWIVFYRDPHDNDYTIDSVHATEASAQERVARGNVNGRELRRFRFQYEEWEVIDGHEPAPAGQADGA